MKCLLLSLNNPAMKKYDSYKDSGIEWIGEIPKHWGLKRLKYIAKVQPSNIDKKSVDGEQEVLLCNYIDVYKNDYIDHSLKFMTATAPLNQIKKFTVEKGDVIVTKDSESPDDIVIPAYVRESIDGLVCGYHLTQIKANNECLSGGYLFWLFHSPRFHDQFKVAANGITRYGVGVDYFRGAVISLPSQLEQNIISNFLFDKTAQINLLIQKKQQLIVLLKEEKIAVINEAVTKGLNSDAPMKESGVELFREVPAHWSIILLRYIGECQNGVSEGAEYFGSGYPFVSYGDVYKSMILPNRVVGLAKSTESDRNRYSVETGDVFFTRTSETVEEIGIASTCIENIDDAVFAGFLIRFRPTNGFLFEGFSKYYFRSNTVRTFFVKEMNLVTRASLSQELLKRLPVLLPPHEEQQKIAVFLDHEMERIQGVINKSKKEISLLQEYRTS